MTDIDSKYLLINTVFMQETVTTEAIYVPKHSKDKYQIIYCIFFLLGSFLGGVNKSGNS